MASVSQTVHELHANDFDKEHAIADVRPCLCDGLPYGDETLEMSSNHLPTTITLICQNMTELQPSILGSNLTKLATGETTSFFQ